MRGLFHGFEQRVLSRHGAELKDGLLLILVQGRELPARDGHVQRFPLACHMDAAQPGLGALVHIGIEDEGAVVIVEEADAGVALQVDTIDVGVPLLSMHAPMEIATKIDIYMMHKASEAFYNAK